MDVEKFTKLLEVARCSKSRQTPYDYSSATCLNIFSKESEDLSRFLTNKEFAFSFGQYLFTCGTAQSLLEPNLFFNWLILRADKVGAAQTAQELSDYLKKDYNAGWQIVALKGIRLSGVQDIGEGLQIMPFSNVPECNMKKVLSLNSNSKEAFHNSGLNSHPAFNRFGPFGEAPGCALVKDSRFRPKFTHQNDMACSTVGKNIERPTLWETALLTTLASDLSPVPLADWSILKESTPLSGFMGGSVSHEIQMKSPLRSQLWEQTEVDRFRDIYAGVMNLDETEKKRVLLSVHRLNQAQNSLDTVSKAIDLGVALESLLLQDSKDQLSLQFSICGARLASTENNSTELFENYYIFKELYSLRSQAAHNGKLQTKEIKLKNERGKMSPERFLDMGINLAKECVRSYIKGGGLNQDGRTKMLLGIEPQSAN